MPSAGPIASYMRWAVGAMTAIVSTSARPVSTCVGGTEGVPIALRRIDSTTEMRTNDVTISSANGISDSAAIARMRTSGRDARPVSRWAWAAAAEAAAGAIAAPPASAASSAASCGFDRRRHRRIGGGRALGGAAPEHTREHVGKRRPAVSGSLGSLSASSSASRAIGPSPTPTRKQRPAVSMTNTDRRGSSGQRATTRIAPDALPMPRPASSFSVPHATRQTTPSDANESVSDSQPIPGSCAAPSPIGGVIRPGPRPLSTRLC